VWPGQPLWDAAHGRAIVPYGLIGAAPGDFNFRGAGQSLGFWRSFDEPVERSATLLFSDGDPPFGVGPVIEGDAYYVFACEVNGGFDKPCRLGARTARCNRGARSVALLGRQRMDGRRRARRHVVQRLVDLDGGAPRIRRSSPESMRRSIRRGSRTTSSCARPRRSPGPGRRRRASSSPTTARPRGPSTTPIRTPSSPRTAAGFYTSRIRARMEMAGSALNSLGAVDGVTLRGHNRRRSQRNSPSLRFRVFVSVRGIARGGGTSFGRRSGPPLRVRPRAQTVLAALPFHERRRCARQLRAGANPPPRFSVSQTVASDAIIGPAEGLPKVDFAIDTNARRKQSPAVGRVADRDHRFDGPGAVAGRWSFRLATPRDRAAFSTESHPLFFRWTLFRALSGSRYSRRSGEV
jgi:hypothetical protein